MIQLFKDFPEDLVKKSINLADIGVDGNAWSIEDIPEVLDSLSENYPQAIVLGGIY